MSEFLPCPFCGVAPNVQLDGDEVAVGCLNGACPIDVYLVCVENSAGKAQAAAMDAWNSRAAPPLNLD